MMGGCTGDGLILINTGLRQTAGACEQGSVRLRRPLARALPQQPGLTHVIWRTKITALVVYGTTVGPTRKIVATKQPLGTNPSIAVLWIAVAGACGQRPGWGSWLGLRTG